MCHANSIRHNELMIAETWCNWRCADECARRWVCQVDMNDWSCRNNLWELKLTIYYREMREHLLSMSVCHRKRHNELIIAETWWCNSQTGGVTKCEPNWHEGLNWQKYFLRIKTPHTMVNQYLQCFQNTIWEWHFAVCLMYSGHVFFLIYLLKW